MAETFTVYRLEAELLALGERVKGGTYRPCITTIPSTQIEGALRASLGLETVAAGYLNPPYVKRQLTFAPSDHALSLAKLPITIEYLEDARGRVFVAVADDLPESFTVRMGGLKSRGFGLCRLKKESVIAAPEVRAGIFRSRIREEEMPDFGITRVIKPVYGYLFKPFDELDGVYCRSIFEGSQVEGYAFLLEEGSEDGESAL